jgi:3-oxoacyl-[acyl-carrier-protein] synthase-3
MNFTYKDKLITGILTVLPANEVKFEDGMENYNFSVQKSLKLKKAMGFNTTRIVEDDVCTSDICVYGMNYLFDNELLKKEDVDALILVTQSPDYLMPPTSNIIQGKLGLKQDMICLDINQGCAGYIVGLMQSFMLLDQPSINKVVMLNADILSKKVSKRDRNSNPLIGDGASITIVEKSSSPSIIHGNLKMEGRSAQVLMIPAGGFKLPSNSETSEMKEDAAGNFRSLDNLVMKGDEVFSFVQREVPPLIEELLATANVGKDQVDYFMFHQPNKFMLNKLADKLEIPRDKMPSNIVENFGNASGVSIPTAITHNLGERPENESLKICIAGFGVGLTWASMIIDLDKLKFSKIIDY